jgi:DNA polymerase
MYLVGIDFETFYDTKNGYSLRKMDNPSYILDARFEATMCAVKFGKDPATWVDGPDLQRFFNTLDPAKTILYGHNLMFDACIASWHYGFVPAMSICTLACARQLWRKDLKSLSLDSLLKHFNLPNKGKFLSTVDGMRRADIYNAGLWPQYVEYATGDIEGAYSLLQLALPEIPADELKIADMVLRMATQPMFKLNAEVLGEYYNEEAERKQALLERAMRAAGLTDVGQLMSNDQFAVALQALGVDPPTKTSLKTGKETWAFAKSDQGMKDLADSDDDAVATLVEARLAHKSTLNITRAQRYLNIAHLDFPAYGRGVLPVPLKVSGAHTHRLSGDWAMNVQNPERNKPALPPSSVYPAGRPASLSKLRRSWEAPDGYVVVACDSSQIEARLCADWCGQDDLVEQFRQKLDAYSIMASDLFARTITKADVPERFTGKQTVLSAQFGVGPDTFRVRTIHVAEDQAGIDLRPILTPQFAEYVIQTYRRKTPNITERRRVLNDLIRRMTHHDCNFQMGPITFRHERIIGPTGLCLYYNKLRWDDVKSEWIFFYGGFWQRLYGGKLLENIIQHLARCVVMQAALRLQKPLRDMGGAKIDLQLHDELVFNVREEYAEQARALVEEEMRRPVPWMPNCPVDCESGVGPNYAEAK